MSLFDGIGARRQRREFRRRLGPQRATDLVVGVEHEYSLFDGDEQTDFRTIVRDLDLGSSHLDPSDPFSYRRQSGSVVTCDTREAEIALPPLSITPGFSTKAVHWATAEAEALRRRLPAGLRMEGYSTHISVEVPEQLVVEVAKTYVERFAPTLMLLMDGAEPSGLRIRPRHRRVELCGDFVDGGRLEEAIEFAVGSIGACLQSFSGATGIDLPPQVTAKTSPAIERRGWFINCASFDLDPKTPRGGTLQLTESGSMPVKDHVAGAMASARAALSSLMGSQDTVLSADTPFSGLLDVRERRGFDMAPVMITWPLTIFMVATVDCRQPAFVVVPREWLQPFVEKLASGDLDQPIRRYLMSTRRRKRLESWPDAQRPGLCDVISSRNDLMPAEPL